MKNCNSCIIKEEKSYIDFSNRKYEWVQCGIDKSPVESPETHVCEKHNELDKQYPTI